MPSAWDVLNRVQFETRRFQFRSSPPWATLEGWYYGFQTGRGLPRPVLPQPVRASFRQRHLLRRLHGGRDFSVAGYLLLFPAQGGADPARPAACAEEPGPVRPDPHASREGARCALRPHPPQPLHRLSLDPPDLRDPAGEFRAPGLWTCRSGPVRAGSLSPRDEPAGRGHARPAALAIRRDPVRGFREPADGRA